MIKENMFVQSMLNYFFLPKEEIDEIANTMLTMYKEIFVKYMTLKLDMYYESRLYKYNIISLGQNCLPHTIAIRCGFKFPNFIRQQDRMFCDLAVTNFSGMVKLLSIKDLSKIKLCDAIEDGIITSNLYSFKYNHDKFDDKESQNIVLIKKNSSLIERLSRLQNSLYIGNCLCIGCCYYNNEDNVTDLINLQKIISNYHQTNRLLIIDMKGNFNKFGEIFPQNYLKISIPFDGFIWYKPNMYLSKEGFEFYKTIVLSILNTIKNNFLKLNTDETVPDAIKLSLESHKYKNTMLDYLKELYCKYRTLRIDLRSSKNKLTNDFSIKLNQEPKVFRKNPSWMLNGYSLEFYQCDAVLNIEILKDGELDIKVRGIDVRNINNERYPIFIDLNFLSINDDILVNKTQVVSYNQFFRVIKKVYKGDILNMSLKWSECNSGHLI